MLLSNETEGDEMNEKRFRTDNTEGYSVADLDRLNAEFERRMADYDVNDPHYADIADAVSDRLHNEFPNF